MLIVDVETTGTDTKFHSLLSIGAIDFDNPERVFFEECSAFPGAKIEEEATIINGIGEIEAFDSHKQTDKELIEHFLEWMKEADDHTIAGQNPQFDTSFLIETAKRYHINFSIPKRIVDLHSATWTHMLLNGLKPPLEHSRSALNSDTIMNYVGIPTEPHPHIAINGAKYEAEAFSRILRNKSFFDEFKGFPIPWLK